jgi:RHS repeat-associated protein
MAGGTTPHERFYDLSGRVTRYRLGNVFRDVTYDAADRIISFTHLSANDGIPQPALDQSFGYDENDRITQVATVASSWAITYDPSGNRTGVSLNGSPSVYITEATSNRLTSVTNPARSFGYDNAGNTISDSPNYTATYGLSGSLASVTRAGLTGTYTYDADKRRIRKVTSAGASSTIIFVYGLNGELLGEYDQTGQALREYIWLDDIPVAMFMPDPANPSGAPLVFYIHADHLNAPRLVVDINNATRWQWFAEPFGTTAPEVNPSGLGAFTQNLRFPGQYADVESGLWYNYRRHYDKTKGGYTQSDPIGLRGGINSYAYALGDPVSHIDPSGLDVLICFYAGGVGHVGFGDGNTGQTLTFGFYSEKHEAVGPGQIRPDTGHQKQECFVLPASPKQDDCMKQCQDSRQSNPGRYSVWRRQCTSYVRDCLEQCGLPSGSGGAPPEPWYRSLPGAEPYPVRPES